MMIMGRPVQIVEHTGKTTNIIYSNLTVTTNDGVSSTSSTKKFNRECCFKTDNGVQLHINIMLMGT